MAPCSTPCRPAHPKTLVVESSSDPEAITRLAGEWRTLLAENPLAHPFYEPAWHRCWWDHLGSGTLHLCQIRGPEGALVAIAPFAISGEGLIRFTGGEDLSDYLDIIAKPENHRSAWQALWDHLQGPEAPAWNEMYLRGLPDNSPTPDTLNALTDGRLEAEQEDVCPVIQLPSSWDEYTGMLNVRDERDLRRKIRKAQMEAGLEFERTLSAAQLDAHMEEFIELHALSQPEKANFWNEERGAFFREMAKVMLELGYLDLSIMRVDGHAAASNFSFDYENRVYLYNSGYDPSEHELSAGLVLLAHNIEDAIQAGRTSFDLLRGDEPYKYRFAAQEEHVRHLRFHRETP